MKIKIKKLTPLLKAAAVVIIAALIILSPAAAEYNEWPWWEWEYEHEWEREDPEEYIEPESEPEPDTDIIGHIINNSVILRLGSPRAIVNGKLKYIDGESDHTIRRVFPFIDQNSRTLVPVRFIAESLGCAVYANFDGIMREVAVVAPSGAEIIMRIGDNVVEISGIPVVMDTAPALTAENRTFIPVRPFAETGLGMNVSFVSSERIIIITEIYLGGDDSPLAEEIGQRISCFLPVWPLDMSRVQAEWRNWPQYPASFGGGYHAGTDFAIPSGNNVYSVYSGIVFDVIDLGTRSYGKYIIIRSIVGGEVIYIYYAHLSEQLARPGDRVIAGDIIGRSGNTGFSTGPHLHFEVRNAGRNFGSLENPTHNPYDFLP
jgi:hypothetical protein